MIRTPRTPAVPPLLVPLLPVIAAVTFVLTAPADGQTPALEAATQPLTSPSLDDHTPPDPDLFKPVSLTIFFENDGAFVRPNHNSDRHYTSGEALHIAGPLTPIDDTAPRLTPSSRDAAGFVFVQQIFTPNDITDPTPDRDDRPYAGYLYGGLFYQRQHYNLNGVDTLDHVELDLGIVGPSSLAEEAQSEIHRLTDDPDPQGWDTQLADEPQVQLNLRRQWRIDLLDAPLNPTAPGESPGWFNDVGLQLIPEASLDIGTAKRRANAGAFFRVGTNLPDDFGPTRLTVPRSAAGVPVRGLSQYLFAGVVGRYVEWDTLLDGSYASDPSRSVDREPWQAEATFGAAIEWDEGPWNFRFTYSQTYLTREFEEQTTDDGYGTIAVTFTYRF